MTVGIDILLANSSPKREVDHWDEGVKRSRRYEFHRNQMHTLNGLHTTVVHHSSSDASNADLHNLQECLNAAAFRFLPSETPASQSHHPGFCQQKFGGICVAFGHHLQRAVGYRHEGVPAVLEILRYFPEQDFQAYIRFLTFMEERYAAANPTYGIWFGTVSPDKFDKLQDDQ